MKGEYWGFIKDPLYGYIKITKLEKEIIDTAPVQRLRRIKQLSGAEYVYPAANHTRFEHSLGAMYLAGVLAQSLPVELKTDDLERVKIAALLHDVGHGPFSHVFDSILIRSLGKTHEDMTRWIVENSEVERILEKEGFSPREIAALAVGRLRDRRGPFLDQIISSGVDVDKMDFIPRDSYHTGAGYGHADIFRLIYSMEVYEGNLIIGGTALSALETFLLARLESFKAIYFHKASRAVQIMLVKALERAKDYLQLSFDKVEDYLALDDYSTWCALKKCNESKGIINDLENRKLLKCAYERIFFTQEKMVTSIFTNEVVRRKMEEEIASEANVDLEHVAIDVPSLPSVPYANATKPEQMDIPIFVKSKKGEKVPRRATELSRIINVMQAFMNIVRVYTRREYREKVSEASERTFGYLPSETTISY